MKFYELETTDTSILGKFEQFVLRVLTHVGFNLLACYSPQSPIGPSNFLEPLVGRNNTLSTTNSVTSDSLTTSAFRGVNQSSLQRSLPRPFFRDGFTFTDLTKTLVVASVTPHSRSFHNKKKIKVLRNP